MRHLLNFNNFLKNICCLLLAGMISGEVSAQFSADMLNVLQGKEHHYKLFSDGLKYRYEFMENGVEGIVIVDPEAKNTHILIPEKKYVMIIEYLSMQAMMNDPYQSFMYYKNNYGSTESGREEIHGMDTRLIEVMANGTGLFTCWFSDQLNFPVKLVNNQAENTYMELSNIRTGPVDAVLFDVPEGYTEVDNKMRPVVEEPEPPQDWRLTEVSIPFNNSYERGEKVGLVVNKESYTKVMLVNNGDGPSKIVRHTYRNGELLPDNEQGPLKYRTNRLFPGEKKNLTMDWEVGDRIVIEVHEGIMNIEVKYEN